MYYLSCAPEGKTPSQKQQKNPSIMKTKKETFELELQMIRTTYLVCGSFTRLTGSTNGIINIEIDVLEEMTKTGGLDYAWNEDLQAMATGKIIKHFTK